MSHVALRGTAGRPAGYTLLTFFMQVLTDDSLKVISQRQVLHQCNTPHSSLWQLTFPIRSCTSWPACCMDTDLGPSIDRESDAGLYVGRGEHEYYIQPGWTICRNGVGIRFYHPVRHAPFTLDTFTFDTSVSWCLYADGGHSHMSLRFFCPVMRANKPG